jgi:hypothetical protein
MRIDLPITIIFDCQSTDQSAIGRAAGKIIGTLQYETDGDGTDALFFPVYPPPDKFEAKYTESGQAIIAHIPLTADQRVNARTAVNPFDYMVGTVAERQAAQDKVDAERDQTP